MATSSWFIPACFKHFGMARAGAIVKSMGGTGSIGKTYIEDVMVSIESSSCTVPITKFRQPLGRDGREVVINITINSNKIAWLSFA